MNYVKLVGKHYENMPDTFCPIDEQNGSIIIGLSLVGFCDGAVVGTYNVDTGKVEVSIEYVPEKEK